MLNDDKNRPNGMNRREGTGGMMVAALIAAAVMIGLFMWAPWGDRTASNTSPGTTVGSSTTRPATPVTPSPAPTGQPAPSTTR